LGALVLLKGVVKESRGHVCPPQHIVTNPSQQTKLKKIDRPTTRDEHTKHTQKQQTLKILPLTPTPPQKLAKGRHGGAEAKGGARKSQ